MTQDDEDRIALEVAHALWKWPPHQDDVKLFARRYLAAIRQAEALEHLTNEAQKDGLYSDNCQ